jgi:flagellar motor switch protein FliG
MTDAQTDRSGVDRAAILLLALGEQDAAQVLKHLSGNDVQRVGAAMAQLSGVSREEVSKVLNTFAISVEQQTSLGVGTDEYLRNVLVGALGEDKAGGVIERILRGRNSRGLEALKCGGGDAAPGTSADHRYCPVLSAAGSGGAGARTAA